MQFNKPTEWGSRFQFPENQQINFDGPRSTVSGFGFVSHFSTCPNAGSFRRK